MVVTHLFQVLAFMAMEPPTALEPGAISEEKNKVFRSMRPIEPATSCGASTSATATSPGVAADSETETFIALRCEIDNWRWAGVPFYNGVVYGIATSGRRPEIDRSLSALGVPDDVVVVDRGDVLRAKPEPDLFLACQQRLGVPPTSAMSSATRSGTSSPHVAPGCSASAS